MLTQSGDLIFGFLYILVFLSRKSLGWMAAIVLCVTINELRNAVGFFLDGSWGDGSLKLLWVIVGLIATVWFAATRNKQEK